KAFYIFCDLCFGARRIAAGSEDAPGMPFPAFGTRRFTARSKNVPISHRTQLLYRINPLRFNSIKERGYDMISLFASFANPYNHVS
ncbi:MAG: hypothetical protein KDH84_18005, partial [Calditrichaeota bacterium]|nr:hypothetical protein [Calditrichota bacterium]